MNFLPRYSRKLVIICSAIILVTLTICHIYMPFYGDQAFFVTGAKVIQEGGILYKDFWDFKQPGIFYFYWVGGTIFSYSEEGIHLFELFYWIIFSISLIYLTIKGKIFNNKWLNYIIPLLTIGIYFNISSKTYLTQVEILVSAPLIILILLLHNFRKSKRFDIYIIIGSLISFILLFKLTFIVAIACLILFHFILLFKDRISFKTILLYKTLPLFLGFVLALTPFILYIIKNNIVGLVYDTFFVAPFDVISVVKKKSPTIFFMNFAKFLVKTFPLIIFSGLIIIENLKKKSELISMLTILLFSSIYIIYMQKFSYFSYQYLLLIFPQGILTLIFFDNFFTSDHKIMKWLQIRMSRLSILILLVALFGVQEYYFVKKTKALLNYFPLQNSNSLSYKEFYHTEYRSYIEETKFIRKEEGEFEIFVCGSPLIYYLSNRKQAIPSNGWALELFTEDRWLALKMEIAEKKPKYIYISNPYDKVVRSRNVINFELDYDKVESNANGIWYKNRG